MLSNEEMLEINGGAIKAIGYSLIIAVGGFIAFLSGVIDGYIRPRGCK